MQKIQMQALNFNIAHKIRHYLERGETMDFSSLFSALGAQPQPPPPPPEPVTPFGTGGYGVWILIIFALIFAWGKFRPFGLQGPSPFSGLGMPNRFNGFGYTQPGYG
jgi:hypothetical protein